MAEGVWQNVPRAAGDEATRLLAAVVESSEDAILSMTVDGTVTSWNTSAERLFGYRASEMVGRPVSVIVPPSCSGELSEWLRRVRRGERVGHAETTRRRKDGSLVPVSVTVSAVRDATGAVVAVSEAARDLSGRRRVEEELRDSESDLRLALDAGGLGDWKWDLVTGEVALSPRCKAIYGLPPDADVCLERFRAAVHPDDRERVAAAIRRAIETRTDYEEEKRVLWPDGSVRWTATRGRVYCDAGGRPVRVAGVTMDVTDRRRAEGALRESEELYRLLTENSHDLIYLLEPDGRIVYTTPSVGRRMGHVPGDKFEVVHPDDVAAAGAYWQHVLAGGTGLFSVRVHDAAGEWHWLEAWSSLITYRGRPHVLSVCRDVTERRRAEEALRLSERKLEESQRIAHVGYWERDLGTGRITWSEEAYRIFGQPPGQRVLNVEQLRRLVHPDDYPAVAEAIERALRGGPRYDIEYRVIRPTGEVRFVRSQGDVIRDEAGRPRSLFGVVQDITEGKQAEGELRRSHRQYQELVASIDGIVWEADARTFQFLFVSGQAERILGYPPERWLREPDFWVRHLHPDDRDWAVAFCLRATGERRNHDFEYRMIAADGRVVWLRDIVSVIVEGGEAAKLRGMMVDVTDRKRTEQALEESERRYREVFNSSSECLFLLDVTADLRFKFVELNPAEERAVGLTTADLAGKFVEDGVPEDVAAAVIPNYRRCVEAGAAIGYEEELSLPVGRRSFHTTLIPVRDGAGRAHRIVGVARDITDSKRAEEQLRVSLREKEALLREVHHRVKNNLQLISSLLSLQAARTRDAGVAELLAESRNRLRSMALVHENLYQLGNFAGIPMATHVRGLCTQLFRSYGAHNQHVTLETRVADVVLDLDRAIPCSLIINELVTNALKHAFPGGRAGRVAVALGREGGKRHRLEVSDDGVGLPAGLDPGRAATLGLQLVADLTEQLRGSLHVNPDGGTAFTITFDADGRGERQP